MTGNGRERGDITGAGEAGALPEGIHADAGPPGTSRDPGASPAPGPEAVPAPGPQDRLPGSVAGRAADRTPGFLELIYGVLFAPADTFRWVAAAPPLRLTLVIATLVNAAGALMSVFVYRAITPPGSGEAALAVLMPYLALIGFFGWYLKWLGYGGVLHLAAQLLGGANGAGATLAVYGLATLPGLFILPVEAVVISAGLPEAASARLVGPAALGVFVWGLVLLVIGLREVHGLTAKRAVATVLLPAGALLLFLILALIILILGLSASYLHTFVSF